MANEQKTYTREFKAEAVRLTETSGKSVAEIARDLGISDSSRFHWRQQLREQGDQAFPGQGHASPADEELRRLRREVEVLKQERDMLKKVVAIFSQGPK